MAPHLHPAMPAQWQVQVELYHEGPADGSGAHPAAAGGRLAPGQRLFRLALRLAFPSATAAACTSRARELLRGRLAAAAGVDARRVTIERIAAPGAVRGRPWLEVRLHVAVGADLLKASGLAKVLAAAQASASAAAAAAAAGQPAAEQQQEAEPATGGADPSAAAAAAAEQMAALLGGEELVAAMGLPDPGACAWDIEDVTPACARGSEAEAAQAAAGARSELPPDQDRRLAHVRAWGAWGRAFKHGLARLGFWGAGRNAKRAQPPANPATQRSPPAPSWSWRCRCTA